MKISVIIAAYKGGKFIKEQLLSLCQQTRLPDTVLIGDDSGDDLGTFEAVQEFRREQVLPFELKFFRNQNPSGVNNNFRNLAEKAEDDIIFFCDQDDLWLPEKIDKLARVFEKEPLIDAVCCFSFLTDGALVPWQTQDESELKNALLYGSDRKKLFQIFLSHKICGAGHNIAIRHTLVRKLPFWDPILLYDLWTLHSAAAAEKLLLLPERLTMHRVHEQNLTISSESYVGGSIFRRLKTMERGGKECREFTRLLAERSAFAEELKKSPLSQEIPPERLKMADEAVSYLKQRIAFRHRFFLFRLFPSLSLLKGYFTYGNGLRSLIRDAAGI